MSAEWWKPKPLYTEDLEIKEEISEDIIKGLEIKEDIIEDIKEDLEIAEEENEKSLEELTIEELAIKLEKEKSILADQRALVRTKKKAYHELRRENPKAKTDLEDTTTWMHEQEELVVKIEDELKDRNTISLNGKEGIENLKIWLYKIQEEITRLRRSLRHMVPSLKKEKRKLELVEAVRQREVIKGRLDKLMDDQKREDIKNLFNT